MFQNSNTPSVLHCETVRSPPVLSSAQTGHTASRYPPPLCLAAGIVSLINQYYTYLRRPIFLDHVQVTLVKVKWEMTASLSVLTCEGHVMKWNFTEARARNQITQI
jgi:hypothetical protein